MSIPVQIPESLTQNKKWADWLAELPAILIACAKKWTLRIEAPLSEDYAQMSFGYITPATRADGEKVILKCVPPPIFAELQEGPALQLCDGGSTVKLLGHDDSLGTIMIEELRMPPNRVIKWGIILSCIWSRWGLDDSKGNWRGGIQRAEALDDLL